jgi:YD repeat-containing protein
VKDKSEQAWRKTLEELKQAHRQLYDAIGRLTEERLADIISGKGYTAYFMLHGVVQHNLYHAGQIALLKKA